MERLDCIRKLEERGGNTGGSKIRLGKEMRNKGVT